MVMTNAFEDFIAKTDAQLESISTAQRIAAAANEVAEFERIELVEMNLRGVGVTIRWTGLVRLRFMPDAVDGFAVKASVGSGVIYQGTSWRDGLDAIRSYIAENPQ